MSNSDKCTGIVLGGFSFGESHKVLKIFTDKFGLIKVVANGIRKTSSKYSGSLELMNIVSILARKSKSSDLFTVRELELITSYHRLRDNYGVISSLYYISEFIGKFFENDSPSIEIYNELSDFLLSLEKHTNNINELRWAFLLKNLKILGYIPELDYCSQCGKKLDKKNIYISGRDGWIFCVDCAEYKVDKKISGGALGFLNLILKQRSYDNIAKFKVNDDVREDLDTFFRYIICGILGKELKSEKMLYFI